ncbi:MAG: dockerin type I repeat-containing protein [Magnetococcales bacterium]|nr:dockerin type I repeat-containing protein [Magnetococcales bacterium]
MSRLWLGLLAFFWMGTDLLAKEQVVSSALSTQKVAPGGSVSITIQYQTGNPAESQVTGLGLKLFFDSSRLTFTGLTDVLQSGSSPGSGAGVLIGQDATPQDDTANLDGDASTDKMLGLAWAAMDGNWPGSGVTWPVPLFKANFTLAAGAVGPAVVHVLGTGTASGYTLTAGNAVIIPSGSAYAVLDVDHDGQVTATDGVLLLRRLSGSPTIDTGLILFQGQTNSLVVERIESLKAAMDVDNDGQITATDGVLILRQLSGAPSVATGLMLPAGQSNATVISNVEALK